MLNFFSFPAAFIFYISTFSSLPAAAYLQESFQMLLVCPYLFSAFLAKGTDGVMKIEVLSLFLLFSIPDIFFLQGRHTTEHVEVSGGAV